MTVGAGEDAAATLNAGPTSGKAVDQVVQAASDETSVPGGFFMFEADYARDGADLVLTHAQDGTFVIRDYFLSSEPADLQTADGHLFPGPLVQSLAGPLAPAQYAQASGGVGADEIGQVSETDGEVWATRSDGVREPLASGASVFQGDVLETGDDGALKVIFLDGTEFSLAGDTRITVDEMIYNPNAGVGSSIISAVQGSFAFVTGAIAATGPDAMQVKTPAGTIGIRGTTVGCVVGSQAGGALCSLLHDEDGHLGQVAFTNATGTILLTRAFETVIGISFNAPLTTRILSEEEVRGIMGDAIGPVTLDTQAPPTVLSSGSVFLPPDFNADRPDGLQALTASDVIAEIEDILPLALPEVLLTFDILLVEGVLVAAASPVSVGENGATQIGTSAEGSLGFSLAGGLIGAVEIAELLVTANGAPVALTSGGDLVEITVSDDGLIMTGSVPATGNGPQAGKEIFTLTVNPDVGTFVFRLEQPLDHLDPNAVGADDVIELGFVVTALVDSLPLSSQILVTVQDDGPTPIDNVSAPELDFGQDLAAVTQVAADGLADTAAVVPGEEVFSLLITIDVSNSMNKELLLPNGDTITRLELSKLAAENLGREFFEVGARTAGDFRVALMVFGEGSEVLSPPGAFTGFADFAQAVRGITDSDGYPTIGDATNFAVAVEDMQDVLSSQLLVGQPENAKNSVYFITDARVNSGPPVDGQAWQDFLQANGIKVVAVAVDPGRTKFEPLLEINEPDETGDPLLLQDVDDLSKDLASSLQPTSIGNILADAEDTALGLPGVDSFGADGAGGLVALQVDSVTYSYDGSKITDGGGFTAQGANLSLQTSNGGSLEFNFESGDYTYVGASFDHAPESFVYTMSDADGDTQSAVLAINPTSFSVSLANHPAGTFTITGFDQLTYQLVITDVLDTEPDGDTDIADLINSGVTLSQDSVTGAVTMALNANTSIVLDGIRDSVTSLEELDQIANIVITG